MCDDGVLTTADETLPNGHELAATDKGPVEVIFSSNRAVRRRTGVRPYEAEDEDNGPDLLQAIGFGTSVDAIRGDALSQARELYGASAVLEVQEIDTIRTTRKPENLRRGPYNSAVFVRCVNFTELGL
jgi:hypothetical protein